MPQFNLAAAMALFSELTKKATLEQEVIAANKPVQPKPGTGKGIWMAPDFDESLDGMSVELSQRDQLPRSTR
jgi:hypothetical protein